MQSNAAGQLLPAADNRIDIAGIELDPETTPPRPFGGYQGCAAAEKAVEHDIAASGAVEDRIGDQRHRLHRRVQRQQVAFPGLAGERVDPGILPDIAAVATKAAKLDVVAVPTAA